MIDRTVTQSSRGLCTWTILLSNGQYVYDPTTRGTGYDPCSAHLWLDHDPPVGVRALAARTPWIGASASVRRSRQ